MALGDPVAEALGANHKLELWIPVYTSDGMPMKVGVRAYFKIPELEDYWDELELKEELEFMLREVAKWSISTKQYLQLLDPGARKGLALDMAEQIAALALCLDADLLGASIRVEPVDLSL